MGNEYWSRPKFICDLCRKKLAPGTNREGNAKNFFVLRIVGADGWLRIRGKCEPLPSFAAIFGAEVRAAKTCLLGILEISGLLRNHVLIAQRVTQWWGAPGGLRQWKGWPPDTQFFEPL